MHEQIPAVSVPQVIALYEEGRYLDAYELACQWGAIRSWSTTRQLIIGGRLALNLGAPRLGNAMHLRAYRQSKEDLEANYYTGFFIMSRKGLYAAMRFLERDPKTLIGSDNLRADWFALRAQIASNLRDFDAAERAMALAAELGPTTAWRHVVQSSLYEDHDEYDASLASAQEALKLKPFYRPAVQMAAHAYGLLGRNDEALELLKQAAGHLQSHSIHAQLASMQIEHRDYDGALASIEQSQALAPLIEDDHQQWYHARMADVCYYLGKRGEAAEHAGQIKDSKFAEGFAKRLQDPEAPCKRVKLDVAFVRQHHMTCAPATLATISRFWSKPADHFEVAEEICYDGTPAHSERQWATTHGWSVREFTVNWDNTRQLIDAGIPFTLTTTEPNNAHLQAVIGYDEVRKTLIIRDPFIHYALEFPAEEMLKHHAAMGPRGMAMIPQDQSPTLEGIELYDSNIYDLYHQLQSMLNDHQRDEVLATFKTLEEQAPDHYLTHQSRFSMADYDANAPGRLEAIERHCQQLPEDEVLLLRKAYCLMSLDRHHDLIDLLETVTQKKDTHPVFHQMLGVQLTNDARQHDQAKRLLHLAMGQLPRDARSYHSLAGLLWERRQFEEAFKVYRIATCLGDKDEHYAQSYFSASTFLKRTDEALDFLRRRFEQFGDQSSLPARTLFRALEHLGHTTEAFEILDRAIAQRPDDGDFKLFVATESAAVNRHDRAVELLELARAGCKKTNWLRAASELETYQGNHHKAIELWRTVLEIEPMAIDAHNALANMTVETEGPAAAIAQLRQATAQFKFNYSLHQTLAGHLMDEDPDACRSVLEHMIKISPCDGWCRRTLASVLLRERDLEEANAQVQLALEAEPLNAMNHTLLAQIHYRQGELDVARVEAQRAIELSVDEDAAVHLLMAMADTPQLTRNAITFFKNQLLKQVTHGDGLLTFQTYAQSNLSPDEALQMLTEAHEARPDLWHAWTAKITQLREMDRLDEALTLAEQATRRFPLLPRIWIDLAEVLLAQSNRPGAVDALQQALQINPHWGLTIRMLSDLREKDGDFDQAIALIEKAVELSPRDAIHQGFLANLYWKTQRREEALKHIQLAVELDPSYEWAWERLRDWSSKLDQADLAVQLAEALTDKRPGLARSWWALANVLVEFDDLERKLEALHKIVELNPRDIGAYDSIAEILAEAQRYDEALEMCHPAIWGDEPPVRLKGRAAWIAAQLGQLDQAIELMKEAVAEDPFYGWGVGQLAEWYLETEDHHNYLISAEKMVALNPNQPVTLGYLGDAHRLNGNMVEARRLLHRAIDIDPQHLFAGYTLIDIYLEDGQIDKAQSILELISPHLSPTQKQTLEIRIHTRAGRIDLAVETLGELSVHPDTDGWCLHQAVKYLDEAHHGKRIEETFATSMQNPNANPLIAYFYIQRLYENSKIKECRQLIKGLAVNAPMWREATLAFMSILNERGQTALLLQFIRKNRKALAQNDETWGEVGSALIQCDQFAETMKWMKGWAKRPGAKPWMMLNYVIALLFLNRYPKAIDVARHVAQGEPDHTSGQHMALLAFDDALHGQNDMAIKRLACVNRQSFGEFFQCVCLMTDAMLESQPGPSPDPTQAYQRARGHLFEVAKLCPHFKKDKILRSLYRKTVKRIVKQRGGVGAKLWMIKEYLFV